MSGKTVQKKRKVSTDTITPTGERIRTFLKNFKVLSPSIFSLAGEVIDLTLLGGGTQIASSEGVGEAEKRLREALATFLYVTLYAYRYDGGPASEANRAALVHSDPALLSELSNANPTISHWDAGWKIFQVGANGSMHIQKGTRATLAQPGQYSFPGGVGRLPGLGDCVDLHITRDSVIQQHGYYHAFSDLAPSDYDFARVARFYFHVPAKKAPALLTLIGSRLNRCLIPYRMKFPTFAQGYDRLDGVVLYVPRRFVPIVCRVLLSAEKPLRGLLLTCAPLFSKELFDGVGAADDPGDGSSFGQARCALLASALRESWDLPANDRIAAVMRFIGESGVSLQAPHLKSGLRDLYVLPTLPEPQRPVGRRRSQELAA